MLVLAANPAFLSNLVIPIIFLYDSGYLILRKPFLSDALPRNRLPEGYPVSVGPSCVVSGLIKFIHSSNNLKTL